MNLSGCLLCVYVPPSACAVNLPLHGHNVGACYRGTPCAIDVQHAVHVRPCKSKQHFSPLHAGVSEHASVLPAAGPHAVKVTGTQAAVGSTGPPHAGLHAADDNLQAGRQTQADSLVASPPSDVLCMLGTVGSALQILLSLFTPLT